MTAQSDQFSAQFKSCYSHNILGNVIASDSKHASPHCWPTKSNR